MGLCPTRYLPFAGDVAAYRALDSIKTAEIAWTRVHAINDYNMCLKEESKWIKRDGLPCDTWTMLEHWIFIAAIFSHPCDCDLTATVTCDRDHPLHLKSSSDGADNAWKNPRIAVQSSRDRAAITHPTSADDDRWRLKTTIVARSWSDRGGNRGLFDANLKPNQS